MEFLVFEGFECRLESRSNRVLGSIQGLRVCQLARLEGLFIWVDWLRGF